MASRSLLLIFSSFPAGVGVIRPSPLLRRTFWSSTPRTPRTRVLVSNLGDNTLQLVEVSPAGRLRALRKAGVGKAPKRVAFLTLP